MPTSIQSAPARCEFRGGIESYCKAASSVLAANHGRFVVCENWLNDHRVYKGAEEAGLQILQVHPFKGALRKKENLFAIYVMKKVIVKNQQKEEDCDGDDDFTKVFDPISVRDCNGKWTNEYAKIMESMSIPVPKT
jgi:hypothetical protein